MDEGLSVDNIAQEVPDLLFDTRLVVLDHAMMGAGPTYRRQFEDRNQAAILTFHSRQSFAGELPLNDSTLFMCMDGMDQAKFSISKRPAAKVAEDVDTVLVFGEVEPA